VVHKLWSAPSMYEANHRTGWSADGKAITFNRYGKHRTFYPGQLQFGPALDPEDFRGEIFKQGNVSLDKNKLMMNGAVLATLPGYHQTLVGANHVATGRQAMILLYD